MQRAYPLPRRPDAFRRNPAAVHQAAQCCVRFFGQIGIPLQIVAENQDVHPRLHCQQHGLLQAVVPGDGLHLHVVADDHAPPAQPLAQQAGDHHLRQRGRMLGVKPGMKQMIEKVKSKGKYVVVHSCGDIWDLMPDLIEMGVDVYNTVQPEIYDLKKLKREYGNDLTFYGAVSTQQFLPYATPAQVYDKTCEVIDIMAKNGGYILSPSHGVTPDIPPENLLAMVKAAKGVSL